MGILDTATGGGGAASIAKYSGATTAMKEVTNAGKSMSWLIFVWGIIHYIVRLRLNSLSGLVFVSSLGLFIFAGWALSQKLEKDKFVIFLPMFVFVLWYFVFGGNYEPLFLLYFSLSFLLISTVFGVFSKGDSVKPELFGLIPVVFFFLDIGMIPFLVEKLSLPITPLMQNLVLFMPWWAFFGLLTLPTEATESKGLNFLINISRIIGILYIVFIFVVPGIPDVGYDKSLLPSPGELEEAQLRLKGQLIRTENPAWSNFQCLISGRYTDMENCVQERQEQSELEFYCKSEGYSKGTESFNECIQEREEEKEIQAYSAGGFYTPSVKEPMRAEVKFNQEQIAPEYNPAWGYSVEVKIENPGKKEFKATFSCDFTSSKDKVTFPGTVENRELEISDDFAETLICNLDAPEQLNGSHNLNFTVRLSGLETTSYLERVFIGKFEEPEKREELISQIQSANVAKESFSSKDFARMNFYLGHTKKNEIIEDKVPLPLLVLTLENLGPGKITSIDSYSINFPAGFEFVENKNNNANCASGTISNYDVKKRTFTFRQCRLKSYPYLGLEEDKWERKTFEGVLKYDYLISKNINVNPDPAKVIS